MVVSVLVAECWRHTLTNPTTWKNRLSEGTLAGASKKVKVPVDRGEDAQMPSEVHVDMQQPAKQRACLPVKVWELHTQGHAIMGSCKRALDLLTHYMPPCTSTAPAVEMVMKRKRSVARNSAPTALAKSSSNDSARTGRPSAMGFASRPRAIAVLEGACTPGKRAVGYLCWLSTYGERHGAATALCQIIPMLGSRAARHECAPWLACAPKSSCALTADPSADTRRHFQQSPQAGKKPPSCGTSMEPPAHGQAQAPAVRLQPSQGQGNASVGLLDARGARRHWVARLRVPQKCFTVGWAGAAHVPNTRVQTWHSK